MYKIECYDSENRAVEVERMEVTHGRISGIWYRNRAGRLAWGFESELLLSITGDGMNLGLKQGKQDSGKEG